QISPLCSSTSCVRSKHSSERPSSALTSGTSTAARRTPASRSCTRSRAASRSRSAAMLALAGSSVERDPYRKGLAPFVGILAFVFFRSRRPQSSNLVIEQFQFGDEPLGGRRRLEQGLLCDRIDL